MKCTCYINYTIFEKFRSAAKNKKVGECGNRIYMVRTNLTIEIRTFQGLLKDSSRTSQGLFNDFSRQFCYFKNTNNKHTL